VWHVDILPDVYKYVLHLAHCIRWSYICDLNSFLIVLVSMPGFLKKLGLGSPEVSEGIAIDEIQSSGNSSPKGEKDGKEVGVSSAHELSEAEAARRLKSQFFSIVFDSLSADIFRKSSSTMQTRFGILTSRVMISMQLTKPLSITTRMARTILSTS
jgi:hypothetical protein